MIKSPRLLPVVIAATTALLLFKGIGLVTSGGYVLTGTTSAVAASSSGEHSGGGEGGTTATSSDPTMTLPEAQTLEDTSPTIADTAPELPLGGAAEASAEGGGHGEAAATATEAPKVPDGPAAPAAMQAACPPSEETHAAASAEGGATEAEAPAEGGEHAAPAATPAKAQDCVPIPVNADGDALAMELNSAGKLAPVGSDDSSEEQLLGRLTERRDELDARAKELDMRSALVEAAEKRLDERTAALKALEQQINSLVEQKKTDEKEQFASIVAMYETMKPKEAAVIFNALDNDTLLRVARAMNPRKMAPILARMEPMKAKTLTASLAREQADPTVDPAAIEDLANLPQIVGQ
ncbi:MAG: hypothetical protein QM702_10360 [Rubrivivax sp.]